MKKITSLVILAIIVIIAIYDVFAIAKGGTEASISHTLQVWAYKYPAMTFSIGFVMGHLFWPISHTKELEDLKKKLKGDQ
jgi:hypothetical protein